MKMIKTTLKPAHMNKPICIGLDTLQRFRPSPQDVQSLDGTIMPTRFTTYLPGIHTTASLYDKIPSYTMVSENLTGFVWDSIKKVLVYIDEADSSRVKELMNFQLEFIGKTKINSPEGTKSYLKYRAFNNDGETVGLVEEAKASQFPKAYDAIAKGLKFHCLVPGDPLIKKYLTKVFCDTEKHLILEELYTLDGWWESPNGELKYLHSGIPNVDNNLLLASDVYAAKLFLQQYFASVSLKVAVPVLIHSAYSMLAKFFATEELPGIRSVLVIIGPSGSGKTKLCSMLSNAFAKSEKTAAFYRLEDTRASLEAEIPKRKDQIVIIDDLFPAGGQTDVNNMEANFNAVVRMAGDAMVRNKCTIDRKTLADKVVRCSMIVTGEYNFLPTFSSYARMTELEIQSGDINIAALQDLIDEKLKSKSFFGLFANYLQNNQAKILHDIRNDFNLAVKFITTLDINQSRLVATFASMLVVEKIVASFAASLGLSSYPTTDFQQILIEFFNGYNLKLMTLSPEKLVIKAIKEAFENCRFKIANDEECYKKGAFEGYIDGDWLIISATSIKNCINEYKYKNKINFVYDERLKKILVQNNFFGLYNGQYSYKYTCSRQVAPRCTVMKINTLLF